MTNTKKKQTGLGVASYFENVPSLEEPEANTHEPIESLSPSQTQTDSNLEKKKIRRTYALSEDAQLALETMKLEARKQGENVTLGDLMEEAITLLAQERRVQVSHNNKTVTHN